MTQERRISKTAQLLGSCPSAASLPEPPVEDLEEPGGGDDVTQEEELEGGLLTTELLQPLDSMEYSQEEGGLGVGADEEGLSAG